MFAHLTGSLSSLFLCGSALICPEVLAASPPGFPGASSRLGTARAYATKTMSLQAMRVEVHHRRPRNKAPEQQLRAMGDHSHMAVQKLAWFDMPGTGTNFMNTLFTWACNLPEHISMVADQESATVYDDAQQFLDAHAEVCPKSFNISMGHSALGDGELNNWNEHKGYFVGMFRDPTERVISSYYARKDGADAELTLPAYANRTLGCAAKMLTGTECAEYTEGALGEAPSALNESIVLDAISRIDAGFGFVGLHEEWGLSVCLFHRMFGGACHDREFVRPPQDTSSALQAHAKAELENWVDPYDSEIYKHAQTRFWETVAKFHLSREMCATEVCPDASNAFLEASGSSKLAHVD